MHEAGVEVVLTVYKVRARLEASEFRRGGVAEIARFLTNAHFLLIYRTWFYSQWQLAQ